MGAPRQAVAEDKCVTPPRERWQCAKVPLKGCLVQVGNGIELEAVGLQFEPYRWRPCGVTWDSSRTVVVIKLRRTSALSYVLTARLFGHIREHRHRRVDLIGVQSLLW